MVSSMIGTTFNDEGTFSLQGYIDFFKDKYFKLDEIQQDIIKTHMFPCNFDIPKYKESWLVSGVDKLVSTYEMLRFKSPLYAGIYALFLFEIIRLPR